MKLINLTPINSFKLDLIEFATNLAHITFSAIFALANKLGSDELRAALLPMDEWAVPAGIINWGIAYLAICLFLLKRPGWALGLMPSLGIVLTLLVATPAYYWPRYEAACYFLVPFYVALAVMLAKPGEALPPKA